MQRKGTAVCPLGFESNSINCLLQLIVFGTQSIITVSVVLFQYQILRVYVHMLSAFSSCLHHISIFIHKKNVIYTLPLLGVNH